MKKQSVKQSALILITIVMVLAMTSCAKNENRAGKPESKNTNSVISSPVGQQSTENSSETTSYPNSKINSTNSITSSAVKSSSSKKSSSNKTSSTYDRYNAGDVNEPTRPAYNLGSCNGRLSGNQMVVLFYMDDDKSSWNDTDIQFFTKNQVVPGLDYLESNAKKWGVTLDFKIKSYTSFNSGVKMKYKGSVTQNLRVTGSTKDVLDNAARDLGYDSGMKLNQALKTQLKVDKIIYFLLLNKDGVSYTRNLLAPGYTSVIEHSILFRDDPNELKGLQVANSRSSVVAHELLHFFGAEDYYVSAKREGLANKLYPNDIMLWQFPDINENTIGDVTAYSVGWTDKVPAVCNQSDWWK